MLWTQIHCSEQNTAAAAAALLTLAMSLLCIPPSALRSQWPKVAISPGSCHFTANTKAVNAASVCPHAPHTSACTMDRVCSLTRLWHVLQHSALPAQATVRANPPWRPAQRTEQPQQPPSVCSLPQTSHLRRLSSLFAQAPARTLKLIDAQQAAPPSHRRCVRSQKLTRLLRLA